MIKNIIFNTYKKVVKPLSGGKFGKLPVVRTVHRFLVSRLKSGMVVIEGNKMYLDSKDSLLLSVRGIYEPFETEFIKKEIRKGDVVVDIGANIGYYTLIFAKLVGPEGKVFAFEPDPVNFALLTKNIETNGYKNVEPVRKAVSNRTGVSRLYLSKSSAADHRIYDSKDGRKSIEIETVSLDDYFKSYKGKIDFIKMDIQGSEGAAIQGMPELLKNSRLKMIMEYWPKAANKFGIDPESLLRLVSESGFKFFELDEKTKTLKPIEITDLRKPGLSPDHIHTNLLCRKDN
jgi:FkbM family methyltransferase